MTAIQETPPVTIPCIQVGFLVVSPNAASRNPMASEMPRLSAKYEAQAHSPEMSEVASGTSRRSETPMITLPVYETISLTSSFVGLTIMISPG
jgi:hypothetical protein